MLTLEKADNIAQKAIDHAKSIGINVSVSIVDPSGRTVILKKMDNAFGVSTEFAYLKAYTSGTLGMPTNKLSEFSGESKPYYGLEMIEGGKFTTIAGGLPVFEGDKIVGGIGVGGSYDVAQDLECATKALE